MTVIALVHTVLTGLLFVSGLRRVRPDHAAILTYGEPVSAVLFGALLLRQPVTAADRRSAARRWSPEACSSRGWAPATARRPSRPRKTPAELGSG